MEEELAPSLRLTGAKAISELRKLERRNSLDDKVLQRKAAESAKKRGNSKNRIKAVTTQIAPFAIPVSVKLLWDGTKVLWSRPTSGLVFFVLQTVVGMFILYLLHTILEGPRKGKEGKKKTKAQMDILLKGQRSQHGSKRRRIDCIEGEAAATAELPQELRAILSKLEGIVLALFGQDSMMKAKRRLSTKAESESQQMLSWICNVVGVDDTFDKESFEAMLEKLEEVEFVIGLDKK